MELLGKENGVDSGEVVEQIQQRLAQIRQGLDVEQVEVLCVEEGEVGVDGGRVEEQEGAMEIEELWKASVDYRLVSPLGF